MSVVLGTTAQNIVSNVFAQHISSPHQRFLQGAAALAVQPSVDYKNKEIDDDTRAVSVARTIGKIVAGTVVGVAVRAGSIGLIKKMSQRLDPSEIANLKGVQKLKTALTLNISKLPKHLQEIPAATLDGNYRDTFGLILGTVAMLFTNFLLDVPLTKVITEKLTPKVRAKIEKDKQGGMDVNC